MTAGRLHLRPWQAGDEAVVLELAADLDTRPWPSLPVPCLPEQARTYVRRTAPDGWSSSRDLAWAVCDSTSAEVLAAVALQAAADPGAWDVAFWCRPAARGQGVVPQALGVVCRWAFAELAAARVQWRGEVGDWGARRAVEKAGFRVEGVLRRGAVRTGARVDVWLAALLPDDPVRDSAALPSLGRPSDGVVALRHWREADLPFVQQAGNDAETARWLPLPVPYTMADARAWALGVVPLEWADGTVAGVAVVDAGTDEPLGAVALTLGRTGTGEIGYWTAPHVRGRGVAVRAVVLHTSWGMSALGLTRVELLADVANTASQRVAEKAGFVREGVARAVRPRPRGAGRVDMAVYARVRPGG